MNSAPRRARNKRGRAHTATKAANCAHSIASAKIAHHVRAAIASAEDPNAPAGLTAAICRTAIHAEDLARLGAMRAPDKLDRTIAVAARPDRIAGRARTVRRGRTARRARTAASLRI